MIDYSEDELDVLNDFIDKYLHEVEQKYRKEIKSFDKNETIIHKIEHIKRTVKLARIISNNNKMAIVAAKFHDIGRIPQFEILGGFRDDLILHHNLGEDLITRLVFKGVLKPSIELDTIRQSVMYHGRMNFIPFIEDPITKEAKEVTEIISTADDLDNGCVGALGYIENEILTDAKHYIEKNPGLDMKMVSPKVWASYLKGEKFDKLTDCKTYADYLLFAAVLAIQSLKGHFGKIATSLMETPCFEYENALDGYRILFSKYIDKSLSNEAYNVLYNYYILAKEQDKYSSK